MNLLYLLHLSLIIFILFGWAILPNYTLKYQMLIVPIIFLDWNDYDGQCILTRLQHYIKTGEWKQKPFIEGGPEFFRPILEYVTCRKYNRKDASKINYVLFIFGWLMTYYKLTKYYNI